MVITMELKHVIKRGETYWFRMRTPQDCVKGVGKKEIIKSLATKDPLVAQARAKEISKLWASNFELIRKSCPATVEIQTGAAVADPVRPFKQLLIDQMGKNLPTILKQESEKQLQERFVFYADAIQIIGENKRTGLDIPELGISWPLTPSGNHGQDRQHRRDLISVLSVLRKAISNEIVTPLAEQPTTQNETKTISSLSVEAVRPLPEDHDILKVTELMLAAKKRIKKTKETVRADICLLKEWTNNKSDITAYSKKDLIDFVQNCLPYLPANIARRGNKYAGKTLRQCIELTKSDPKTYPPISHVTCGNRLDNTIMVFNYAKDHLGIISVNPAMGIEIPKINTRERLPRGFTPDELDAMWSALEVVKADIPQRPSHYWTTVLSLYHGFRLNEVCGLFLKDIYEDSEGVFVIDINAAGQFKSVKNQSSVRIIPVHPFVRDQLGFKVFVERQKSARNEGVLFTDVTGNVVKGYRDRMSKWFANWKKEWLVPKFQYKHFHDLRYTFAQNAQNVAKMPDRYAQEITGHAIEGVSAVHLGYSGRLKPSDLLPELAKVRYGWESRYR